MHIAAEKLDKLQDALMRAQSALAPSANLEQQAHALAAVLVAQSYVTQAKDERAAAEEVERARAEYADDDTEIDDDAGTSRPDDGSGLWVQAWVWLALDPDDGDDGESDMIEGGVWSGSPHPDAPDSAWVDDSTGEAVCAHCGERAATLAAIVHGTRCEAAAKL
jgi:hypothetical protein